MNVIQNQKTHAADAKELANLVRTVWRAESNKNARIQVVLVDDAQIQALNREFLRKEEPTDVLAFPYTEEHEDPFEGEIYVSVDTVRRNAAVFGSEEREELRRVIIHGVLHFLGYRDQSEGERQRMVARENFYLNQLR